MKLRWLLLILTGMLLVNCSKDDDDGGAAEMVTGIPDNSKAGATPTVSFEESNVSIPNVGFAPEEVEGHKIINMSMTGIFNTQTGD